LGGTHSPDAEMKRTDPKKGGIHGDKMKRVQKDTGTKMLVRIPIINMPAWLKSSVGILIPV
jgi:hypothetical protein